MILQYIRSDRGVSLFLVLMVFLMGMILVYMLLTRQTKEMIVMVKQDTIDKAVNLADAGIETAIDYLKTNPGYIRVESDNEPWPVSPDPRLPSNQPVPLQLKGKGRIYFTVSDGPLAEQKTVISTGVYTASTGVVKHRVRAVLEVESPGRYFLASVTDFKIGAGAQMHFGNGLIWGNVLEFLAGPPPSQLYEARYVSDCIPFAVQSSLVSAGYTVFHKPGVALDKDLNRVFPVISPDLMKHYWDIANNGGVDSSFFDPVIHTNITIPKQMANMSTNNSNIFYFPADDPLTGACPVQELVIDSLDYDFIDDSTSEPMSCILVVNGDLRINGNITNNDYQPFAADINPKKYALGFIVQGDVILNINVVPADLYLEGILFIATNGEFKVDQGSTSPNINNLYFFGGAMFRDTFDVARGCNNRRYEYDQNVKDINNLPYMVSQVSYTTLVAQ